MSRLEKKTLSNTRTGKKVKPKYFIGLEIYKKGDSMLL